SVRSDAFPITLPDAAADIGAEAAQAAVTARFAGRVGAPTKVVVATAPGHAAIAWRVPVVTIPLAGHFFVWVDAADGAILSQAPAGVDQTLRTLPERSVPTQEVPR